MESIEWAAIVSAGATAILAIYAGIQVWLLRNDVRESQISRDATVVLYVLGHMDELRDKWHALYALPQDHQTWNAEQRELADFVCVKLQQVAYLAESSLFDEGYLLENHAGVFYKCWQKLENFVMDYRVSCGEPRTIGEGAFQRRHLEVFAQKCGKYLEKFPRVAVQDD